MLEYYFKRPDVQARVRTNLLYRQIRKLIYYLHDCGYRSETIQSYMQKIEHFGIWLRANGIQVNSVNRDTITLFLDRHLPNCRCTLPCSRDRKGVRAALNRLFYVLPSCGQKRNNPLITSIDKEIQNFRNYMNNVCGFSTATIRYRVRYAAEFLTDRFGTRKVKHRNITPGQIMKYVSQKAKQCKTGSTKVLACSLRCYFRFLQFEGICSRNLIDAVPTIRNWKLATLPQIMTKEQLSRFLASFNHKTPSGQRDYAIALCFLELALRASEVTNLLLDDIDWKNSTVNIRTSKTSRSRILPLTVGLGKALVAYLQNGRPRTNSRNIFIRHSVPKGEPITVHIVQAAMCHAHKKADYGDQFTGTHVFRHTAATRMYQKGATLKEIADVLGHKCLDSTTIYTKLNLKMLAEVALPWPEVKS